MLTLTLTNNIDFAISIVSIQLFVGPARRIIVDLHAGYLRARRAGSFSGQE